ncbi:hypothetical protein V7S43_004718 [Phytophthora oleae]|uniref:Uncharacterized protein n=1 Tax=Phytophthora oleae TaxID=2107226 RepID=A0ABD3FZL6_9STRA
MAAARNDKRTTARWSSDVSSRFLWSAAHTAGTTGAGAMLVIGAVQRLAQYMQDVAAPVENGCELSALGPASPEPRRQSAQPIYAAPTSTAMAGVHAASTKSTGAATTTMPLITLQQSPHRRGLPVRYGGLTPVDRRSGILKPSAAMASVADSLSKLGDPLSGLCTATRDSRVESFCFFAKAQAGASSSGERSPARRDHHMRLFFPDGNNSP